VPHTQRDDQGQIHQFRPLPGWVAFLARGRPVPDTHIETLKSHLTTAIAAGCSSSHGGRCPGIDMNKGQVQHLRSLLGGIVPHGPLTVWKWDCGVKRMERRTLKDLKS